MGKHKGSLARSSSKLKKEKKREKEKKKERLKQKNKAKTDMDEKLDGMGNSQAISVGETIDLLPATAVESSSPAPSAAMAVNFKGKRAAIKGKAKVPAFAGPTVPRIIVSSPAPTTTITTNPAGKGMVTEGEPKVPAFVGPVFPRLMLHKRVGSLGNISEEDLQLRLTQSLDEIRLRSNSVPFITVNKCDENDTQDTVSERATSPTDSIRSMEFSLKTRKHSYARRSMFHRFSSVSDGVWSVLGTTANAARNTLKVPPMWEWKGTTSRKERLGKYSEKKSLLDTENEDDGSFPYAGDWKTGARYRYYYRTAPVGSGFIAVGKSEKIVKENMKSDIFSPDFVKLAARRKSLGRGLVVTNPDGKDWPCGSSTPPPTEVGPASAPVESVTNPVQMEEEEVSEAELERLLVPYGCF
ncbi:hypothetical protein EV426DRAFT_578898 [Tirmania nivea]|nr:hypothetical protein EV426DRAFT_578898 [Tirmania nivea]